MSARGRKTWPQRHTMMASAQTGRRRARQRRRSKSIFPNGPWPCLSSRRDSVLPQRGVRPLLRSGSAHLLKSDATQDEDLGDELAGLEQLADSLTLLVRGPQLRRPAEAPVQLLVHRLGAVPPVLRAERSSGRRRPRRAPRARPCRPAHPGHSRPGSGCLRAGRQAAAGRRRRPAGRSVPPGGRCGAVRAASPAGHPGPPACTGPPATRPRRRGRPRAAGRSRRPG